MKVIFENVGYGNASWQAELNGELTYEWLYGQVKGKCMSRDIDFMLEKADNKKGVICAGFHKIGTFRIEE